MATPPIFDDIRAQTSGRVLTDLIFTSGASGAVPSTLSLATGITSVTRNSTGNYTILFDGSYPRLMQMHACIKQASYAKTGACDVRLITDSISNVTTPTIIVLTVDGDGDAVDMASGDILRLTVEAQWVQIA